MSEDAEKHGGTIRDFSIPAIPDLPPIAGEPASPAAPVLAQRLWTLMKAARCHVIAPPAREPERSFTQALDAVVSAAKAFELPGGIALAQRLWTRSGPLRDGEIAARLRQDGNGRQGFILLFGQSVSPRAVFLGHASPVIVEEAIEGELTLPGPYLALLVSTLEPTGKAVVLRGYAQAIASGKNFMPILNAFERDVLFVLGELQERLDAHGANCTLRRTLDACSGAGTDVWIEVERGGASLPPIAVRIDAEAKTRGNRDGRAFTVRPSDMLDGSFVTWLQDMLGPEKD